MIPVLISLTTFVSTVIGGLFALKYKKYIHLILGFTSGVILGVISFDIFPEIIRLVNKNNYSEMTPMIALVVGFLLFHILEKAILIHHSHENDYVQHSHPHVGILSAIALSGHSFLDGVGIGIGFQINSLVGVFVALAVIGHDFADGINTVSLMIAHKNPQKNALRFLFVDAVAPILGTVTTIFFRFPEEIMILYLGYFAGTLLYIGASDILPEAHRRKKSLVTIALTVAGTLFIYILTRVI